MSIHALRHNRSLKLTAVTVTAAATVAGGFLAAASQTAGAKTTAAAAKHAGGLGQTQRLAGDQQAH